MIKNSRHAKITHGEVINVAWSMSRSLVIAVDSLHRAVGAKDNKNHGDHFEAIVHRDIKPKNIGVLKKNPEGVRLVIKVNNIYIS